MDIGLSRGFLELTLMSNHIGTWEQFDPGYDLSSFSLGMIGFVQNMKKNRLVSYLRD